MRALLNCLYISNSVSLTENSEFPSQGTAPLSIGAVTNEATAPSRALQPSAYQLAAKLPAQVCQ